ncbi:MAG: hypothetical protein GY786_12340 [Proteobacteria bacterium]|nr:hypothetical protein [Pseudomonadota bacterium]
MNANTFVAVASMVLVVTYLLVMGIDTDSSSDKTRFFPESTLIYYEQNTGVQSLRGFAASPLGQKIKAIDFRETAKKIDVQEDLVVSFEKVQSFYKELLNDEIFNELFSKNFAIALVTSDRQEYQSYNDLESFLRQNTIIVTEPKHNAKFLTFAAKNYDRFSDEYSLSVSQYGNHNINRIAVSTEQLSVVAIDGLLVSSLNERLLRKSIDVFDGERAGLKTSPAFQAITNATGSADHLLYIEMEAIRAFLVNFITEKQHPWKELLLKELQTTTGFTAVGYAAWANGALLTDKIIAHYNKDTVNKIVRHHLEIAPVESSMLSFTTSSPAAYYWSNTLDFRHFLPYLLRDQSVSPGSDDFESKIEQQSGQNMAEIFAALGEEVSVVVETGDPQSFFPVPLTAMFVQIADVVKVKTGIEKIVNSTGIPIKEQVYGPVSYHYWAGSPQDGLKPLYGFLGNYLFLANSSNLLQRIVDNYKTGKTVAQIGDVKDIDPGFIRKNNSLTYFNNVELIDIAKKVLSFSSTMLALEDRTIAYKSQIIISDIINPLLEGLKMYDRSCTRSYFTEDLVIVESMTSRANR